MQEEPKVSPKGYSDEIDFQQIVYIISSKRKIIFSVFLFFLGLSVLISLISKPVYQSSTVIFLGKYESTVNKAEYARLIILSKTFLDNTANQLGLEEIDKKSIEAIAIKDNFLNIAAYSDSREQAQLIADKIAELYCVMANAKYEKDYARIKEYIHIIDNQISQVDVSILNSEKVLENIGKANISSNDKGMREFFALEHLYQNRSQKNSLVSIRLQYQEQLDNLLDNTVIQKANFPKSPIKPNKKRNVLFGGILGLMAGVVTAFVLTGLERSRKE